MKRMMPFVIVWVGGCLERPEMPACLNDADCRGGLCSAGRCVDAPDDGMADGPRGLDRGRPDGAAGMGDGGMGDGGMGDGPPDADAVVGPACPPPRDGGAPPPDADPGDAAPSLIDDCIADDVSEGELECEPPLRVEVSPAIGSTERHIALAVGAVEGPIAVAWIDPPDACPPCSCDVPPIGGAPQSCDCDRDRCVCAACPVCEVREQQVYLACLDRDTLAPLPGARWQHGVRIKYRDHMNYEPYSNRLDLVWHAERAEFVLSWAETREQDYDPGVEGPALGPDAITVGLFDQRCQPLGFHHAWETSQGPGSPCCIAYDGVSGLTGPRLLTFAGGDRVASQAGFGGACAYDIDLAAVAAAGADTLNAASASEAVCARPARQCNDMELARPIAGADALWTVSRASNRRSACLQRTPLPAAPENCAEVDGGGRIFELDRHLMGSHPEVLSVSGDEGAEAVMVWSAYRENACPVGRDGGRAPIFLQRFTPGRLADDAWVDLPALPGRARGEVVRLANANFAGILPSLAWDACRSVYYLVRDRAEGLTLSRVSDDLRPEGMRVIGELHRGRVAVANGDPVVASVGDTGAIEVRRFSCR